jgi:hypothetical protein
MGISSSDHPSGHEEDEGEEVIKEGVYRNV